MIDERATRFLREHAHYRDDVDWWCEQAARLGGPVLDIGAAAGRVAIALAARGHEVWALDRSPDMLATLEEALAGLSMKGSVHTVRADMCDFELDRSFALVIIAMNTFQVLTEPADQIACLKRVRDHLAPGGELAFDVALPDAAEIVQTLGLERDCGSFIEPDGTRLVHSAWYDSWDPISQTLEFTHRVRERARGRTEREFLRHHRVHLFMPVELEHLLARAGLETIELRGDFSGGPVVEGAQTQVRRCRVAA